MHINSLRRRHCVAGYDHKAQHQHLHFSPLRQSTGIPSRVMAPTTRRLGQRQVLELSRCSVTDGDLSIISKGLVDARCRLRVLQLSGNIDLRDRGVNGASHISRLRCGGFLC
ncbi:unnamed protein product [Ectocarpus sp. 8 AP-2014]